MSTLGDDITALRERGLTYNQIKEELGCSKGTIAYYLGDGQREKTRARNRDKRNRIVKYLQEVKQASPCADCGENYPHWIMDFDHLKDKRFGICESRSRASSLDDVKKELENCELVCANCHRNRTHFRMTKNGDNTPDISQWYN